MCVHFALHTPLPLMRTETPPSRRQTPLMHPTHQALPTQVRMLHQAPLHLLRSDYQGNRDPAPQILNLLMTHGTATHGARPQERVNKTDMTGQCKLPLSGNVILVMTQISQTNTKCLPTSVTNASERDHKKRNLKEQGQMRRLRTRSNVYAGHVALVLLATIAGSIRNIKTTQSGTAPSARRTIRAMWTQAPYA